MTAGNITPERRKRAVSWIRRRLLDSDMSEDAQLVAAVGTIIADDAGRISRYQLGPALRDPSTLDLAGSLLDEARAES